MQLILNVPDNKVTFFMELVSNLGFIEVAKGKGNVLSSEQIQLVEIARKKAKENSDELVDWETALQQIDWDAR